MAVLTGQEAQFEAVAIKRHDAKGESVSTGSNGSDWTATGASLLLLMKYAFPEFADDGRIVGATGWMLNEQFDVRAKANALIAYPAATAMIRSMVIDRFRVRSHVEPRPMDVYVARLVDGKPGPWLMPTPLECVSRRRPSNCGRLFKAREAKGERALNLAASPLPLVFATFRQLGGIDRLIVDRTGLDGRYDVSVKYDTANAVDAKDGATSLVAAARDQLGITFEAGREMLDVLVIDS